MGEDKINIACDMPTGQRGRCHLFGVTASSMSISTNSPKTNAEAKAAPQNVGLISN